VIDPKAKALLRHALCCRAVPCQVNYLMHEYQREAGGPLVLIENFGEHLRSCEVREHSEYLSCT
jgi:hypothetical protein